MAAACLHLLEHYDQAQQVNVGAGTDVTAREVAETVARVVGYAGETLWDASKPDGTPQKLLDVSKLAAEGWMAPRLSNRREELFLGIFPTDLARVLV